MNTLNESKCIFTFENGKQLVATVNEENAKKINDALATDTQTSESQILRIKTTKNEQLFITKKTLLGCVIYTDINIKNKSNLFKLIHNVTSTGGPHSAHTVTYDIMDSAIETIYLTVGKYTIFSQLNGKIKIYVDMAKLMYLQYNE